MTEALRCACVPIRNCLVAIYASFEARDYRTLGVIVGPRTVLTCGHTVRKNAGDGPLERLILDAYPRRLGRASLIGSWNSRVIYLSKIPEHAVNDRVAALHFLPDPGKPERTAPFWRDSIAPVAGDGDLDDPAYLLSEEGLVPWPCETANGYSGAPLFSKQFELVGVHYGREKAQVGTKRSSLTSPPLWTPLPEGRPWNMPSSASSSASAAKDQDP